MSRKFGQLGSGLVPLLKMFYNKYHTMRYIGQEWIILIISTNNEKIINTFVNIIINNTSN